MKTLLAIAALAAFLVFVLATRHAAAQGAPSATHDAFRARIAPVRALLTDPDATFGASRMYEELVALDRLAASIGESSAERIEVLDLLSLLQSKRAAYEDVVSYGKRALALDRDRRTLAAHPRALLHHRIAVAATETGDHDSAIAHYRECAAIAAKDPAFDAAQRLGLRQSIAHVLHEAGYYEAAADENRVLLAAAEHEFGADDARLTGVLNNLAQNLYQLGRPAEATPLLERRLALADASGKHEVALDTLFQLGVLEYEAGRIDAARRRMTERTARARAVGDDAALRAAQDDLAELESRIAASGAPATAAR
jgi:tetratricopeptide (TPR) repeat protein